MKQIVIKMTSFKKDEMKQIQEEYEEFKIDKTQF